MSFSNGGDFTKSFLSLQLQVQTLLEGVGGSRAAQLLDTLAKLSEGERDIIVPLITRLIERIMADNERVFSKEDLEKQAFEEALYESLVDAIKHGPPNAHPTNGNGQINGNGANLKSKLAIVPGGRNGSELVHKKPIRLSSLIDLSKARETRRSRGEAD